MKHISLPAHIRKELLVWLASSLCILASIGAYLSYVTIKMYKHSQILHSLHTQVSPTNSEHHKDRTKLYNRLQIYQKKQQTILEMLNRLPQFLTNETRVSRFNYHYKQPIELTLESHSALSLKRTLVLLSMHYPYKIKEVEDTKSLKIVCQITS